MLRGAEHIEFIKKKLKILKTLKIYQVFLKNELNLKRKIQIKNNESRGNVNLNVSKWK